MQATASHENQNGKLDIDDPIAETLNKFREPGIKLATFANGSHLC